MKYPHRIKLLLPLTALLFAQGCNQDRENGEAGEERSGNPIAAEDAARGEYRVNDADRQVFKKFEGHYEVSSTIGKRNGLNGLEILLAALDSMDWSGASPHLVDAVNEMKSIGSGEAPESRNRKMEKFMAIYDQY